MERAWIEQQPQRPVPSCPSLLAEVPREKNTCHHGQFGLAHFLKVTAKVIGVMHFFVAKRKHIYSYFIRSLGSFRKI